MSHPYSPPPPDPAVNPHHQPQPPSSAGRCTHTQEPSSFFLDNLAGDSWCLFLLFNTTEPEYPAVHKSRQLTHTSPDSPVLSTHNSTKTATDVSQTEWKKTNSEWLCGKRSIYSFTKKAQMTSLDVYTLPIPGTNRAIFSLDGTCLSWTRAPIHFSNGRDVGGASAPCKIVTVWRRRNVARRDCMQRWRHVKMVPTSHYAPGTTTHVTHRYICQIWA